jgi:P-type E1-E2 ATPase
VAWKDIEVGDVIEIKSDQQIPADVIILRTSEEKGVCYVETKSLDGETNLKMKSTQEVL